MKRITVFCGSSPGIEPAYSEHAFQLGKYLAKNGLGIVYGGAKIGLMGAVADGARSIGGEVIGIIPTFLSSKEIAHDGLSDLVLVDTMHERKMKMNELCDGVIALPGGFGTLEEFFEMLTWGQLGLHRKPIALYNMHGFYTSLMSLLQNMVDMGFLKQDNFDMVIVGNSAEDLLSRMKNYSPPFVGKWLTEEET
jgi:uncharacterized protein (TIGR00730 family)